MAASGVPIGLDVLLGPARLFLDGRLLCAASFQRSTGPSSLGSLTIPAGYRLVL